MPALGGHLALCKASVLYLGSAVPLETAVGLEAFQMPCRERYGSAIGADMNISGIDCTAVVYSSGLSLQYAGDPGNVTWFPMQTLHACAAMKASSASLDGRPRFVALDSPEAEASRSPPMFGAIMRRTRGIKVLECHVFICKSTEAALTMVQAMTHAFQHREGWQADDATPPGAGAEQLIGGGGSRLVAAGAQSSMIQKFAINQSCPPAPQCPAPAPAPACPPAPTCPPQQPAVVVVPVPAQNQYFSNWDSCGGQAMMFIPGSPFYPGAQYLMNHKHKHHKNKKSKKKNSRDDQEEEEEVYVMRKSNPVKPKPHHHHEVVEYYAERAQKPRDPQPQHQDLIIYAPSEQRYYGSEYLVGPNNYNSYNYYHGDACPVVDYGPDEFVAGQQYEAERRAAEDYILARQQYETDVRAAEEYDAAAQYEAELQAVDEYNQAAYDYNQALVAGLGQPDYIADYPDYYGDGYGGLIDGLGYYP